MKYRSIWQGILGVSLTGFLVAVCVPGTAETVPGDTSSATAAKAAASNMPPALAEASAPEPVEADSDAPAKLVSTEKPLPASIRPSSPAAEVVKLANSGLDEAVMLAFVTNSTSTFNLGAEEIIYLNDIGVPGAIVTAMIQRDQELKTSLAAAANPPVAPPEPAAAPLAAEDNSQVAGTAPGMQQAVEPGPGYPAEAPLTPPDDGADTMFYDSLAPYGSWVDIAGYGRCWQPTVVLVNSGWQPYFDCGHWVYSDCGWYWLSDYSWGWAPFHYGSWFRHGRLGWCWAPGRVWGPSWVCWRYGNDFCGWAPLPPGASFAVGVGLTFQGRRVWDRDDLGLRPDHYHFVAWSHFNDRELRPYRLPRQEAERAYANSMVGTRISGDGHTVINNGLPPSQVVAATHRPIHTVALREVNEPVAAGGRAENFEAGGRTLAVYRPNAATAAWQPARGSTTGFGGAIRSPSGSGTPSAAPASSRSTSSPSRHSSNETWQSKPLAGKSAPLILRGPQSSALRESVSSSSLVVVGGGRPNQTVDSARPWNTAPASKLAADPPENDSPKPGTAVATAPQNSTRRPVVNQNPERSWMGTVSSSPSPSWFAGNGDVRPAENRVPAGETRSYQPAPRYEVPRYSPAPSQSYTPQRSYSAPTWSAPARSPSFDARPAPAPSAPAPAVSHSAPSQPQSSGRSGR